MVNAPLTVDQAAQFHDDGYLIVKNLLDSEEADLLLKSARQDEVMMEHAADVKDGQGRNSKLSLWNHPGNDIYGMVARSERIVGAMEQLLAGEVYHYHSKMMLKEPLVGGAWEWHQDYGYWYNNGCLFPLMASCMIALDAATRENGCLQVLRGSHLMGRIDHGSVGGQTGADLLRVAEIEKRLELVHVELNPGDGLLFHCNLLHRSAENTSENSRWTLICCYNAARNYPYKEHNHPGYTPLSKVPDSAIKEIGVKTAEASQSYMARSDK